VLGDEVPVPEVYGWRVHDDQVFIYMQLIQGQALIDQWDSLSISDKMVVCDQLRGIVTSLRSVEQDPDDVFIGMLWNL
jgi:aminoglycoside phosphotransferase